jgi:peptidoglycan hydrolase-like protein with peptidoglycan-binding domain
MDAASISEVQTLLKELGYPPGPIDGMTGPLTRKAIHDYLWAKGLAGNDEPSLALLARLRFDATQKR